MTSRYECTSNFRCFPLVTTPKGGPSGTNGAGSKTEIFDFLVVATGMYGWPPHMPVARGSQKFQGLLGSKTLVEKRKERGNCDALLSESKSKSQIRTTKMIQHLMIFSK